jgi:hypothetical protein
MGRFCDDRACALNADFTVCLQSDDSATLLAGLKTLIEKRDFTAHLFSGENLWGAWVPCADDGEAESIAARVAPIPDGTGHWIRMMVEDERDHAILFDRTFRPGGDVTEPMPGW